MVLSKDIKFAICFGLIVGALFSFCSLCFAAETVNFTGSLPNATLEQNSIRSDNNFSIYYLEIEPGYIYNVLVTGKPGVYSFGDDVSIGATTSDRVVANTNSTFSFTYSNYSYLYFLNRSSGGGSPTVSITREPLEGMSAMVDNLAYTLSFSNVWSVLGFVVPIIAIAIIFVLGFYLIKKLINRIKHTKGGV